MTQVNRSTTPTHWETLSPDELLADRQRLFEKQWAYLWKHSDFYKRKLSAAGLSAERCPDLLDLSRIPFTTKDEFRTSQEAVPPFGDHLAADRSQLRQIHTSSGTTGKPMAIALTASDAEATSEILRRGFLSVGFRPEDTILHAFSMSRAWIGGVCMVEGYLKMGATILPLGAESGRDKIIEMMQMFHPTGLAATPGFLYNLGLRTIELGIDPKTLGVKHLLTGGEPGGGIPSIRNQISSIWGCPIREVMGGTDFYTMVWAECEVEDGMHFMASDYGWFELIDPDTGINIPIAEGAVGEVVYTHLFREAVPILRFKHRDIIKVTGMGACRCGRHSPKIRCIGRADDMLIVRGVNLFPSAVRAVILEDSELGSEFRIVRPKGQYTLPGPVKIKIESNSLDNTLKQKISELLHHRLSVAFDVELVPIENLSVEGAFKSGFFIDV